MSIKFKLPNQLYSEDPFSTQLNLESKCNPQNYDNINIDYTLKSKFKINAENQTILGNQKKKSMANSKIEHRYKIWNSGPSITNKDYTFTIGLPKSHVNAFSLFANMNCTKSETNGTNECLNDIKDAGSDELNFVQYICLIEKGLMPMRQEELNFKIDFKTNSVKDKNGKVPDKYVLPSFIKLPDDNGCVIQSTVFLTSFIGDVEAKSPIWPVIVGVCVGIIVVAVSIFLMWKYEVFSKLRIKYPDQFEDVVELGKLNQ